MPLKHPIRSYPLDSIMPGAAPSLKSFARHPHVVQHQDGAPGASKPGGAAGAGRERVAVWRRTGRDRRRARASGRC